ncbi:hypothetical protein D3C77_476700 [compost metagenome]
MVVALRADESRAIFLGAIPAPHMGDQLSQQARVQVPEPVSHLLAVAAFHHIKGASVAVLQPLGDIHADRIVLLWVGELPHQQQVGQAALPPLIQCFGTIHPFTLAGYGVHVVDQLRGPAVALGAHGHGRGKHPAPRGEESLQRRAGEFLLHLVALSELLEHIPLTLLVGDDAVHCQLHRVEVFGLFLTHGHATGRDIRTVLGILPPGEEVKLPVLLSQFATSSR